MQGVSVKREPDSPTSAAASINLGMSILDDDMDTATIDAWTGRHQAASTSHRVATSQPSRSSMSRSVAPSALSMPSPADPFTLLGDPAAAAAATSQQPRGGLGNGGIGGVSSSLPSLSLGSAARSAAVGIPSSASSSSSSSSSSAGLRGVAGHAGAGPLGGGGHLPIGPGVSLPAGMHDAGALSSQSAMLQQQIQVLQHLHQIQQLQIQLSQQQPLPNSIIEHMQRQTAVATMAAMSAATGLGIPPTMPASAMPWAGGNPATSASMTVLPGVSVDASAGLRSYGHNNLGGLSRHDSRLSLGAASLPSASSSAGFSADASSRGRGPAARASMHDLVAATQTLADSAQFPTEAVPDNLDGSTDWTDDDRGRGRLASRARVTRGMVGPYGVLPGGGNEGAATSAGGAATAAGSAAGAASSAISTGGSYDNSAYVVGNDRKVRFMWTPVLHRRFIAAMFDIGIKNATPKSLFDNMEPQPVGMTSEHIKSHLQKFRANLGRSREAFLADYERALREATAKAKALEARTGEPVYPPGFSTFPVAMPAHMQAEVAPVHRSDGSLVFPPVPVAARAPAPRKTAKGRAGKRGRSGRAAADAGSDSDDEAGGRADAAVPSGAVALPLTAASPGIPKRRTGWPGDAPSGEQVMVRLALPTASLEAALHRAAITRESSSSSSKRPRQAGDASALPTSADADEGEPSSVIDHTSLSGPCVTILVTAKVLADALKLAGLDTSSIFIPTLPPGAVGPVGPSRWVDPLMQVIPPSPVLEASAAAEIDVIPTSYLEPPRADSRAAASSRAASVGQDPRVSANGTTSLRPGPTMDAVWPSPDVKHALRIQLPAPSLPQGVVTDAPTPPAVAPTPVLSQASTRGTADAPAPPGSVPGPGFPELSWQLSGLLQQMQSATSAHKKIWQRARGQVRKYSVSDDLRSAQRPASLGTPPSARVAAADDVATDQASSPTSAARASSVAVTQPSDDPAVGKAVSDSKGDDDDDSDSDGSVADLAGDRATLPLDETDKLFAFLSAPASASDTTTPSTDDTAALASSSSSSGDNASAPDA